jgi:hypothetical protein
MLLNLPVRVRVKKVGRRTALTLTLSPRERGIAIFLRRISSVRGLVLPAQLRCRAVILAAGLKLAAKIAALQFLDRRRQTR